MSEQVISKREIACEYLDAAIEFYLAGTNLFCAIHLAAAAEELLGKHLPEKDRIFTSAWRAEKALKSEKHPAVSDKDARKSVNESKNWIKHMGNGDDETVLIDPKLEALFYIEHAWINFNKLGACLLIPRPADCDLRVPNRISSGGQCSSERAAGRTGSDQRVVVLIPGEMGFEPLSQSESRMQQIRASGLM